MEEKLAQLVYEYAKEKKEIDNSFIVKAFTIIKNEYQTKNMVIKNEEMNRLAAYKEDVIRINKKAVIEVSKEHKDLYSNINTEFDFFKYIYFIKILLHEFEHAKQQKTIQYENSIEGYIVQRELNILNILYNTRKNYAEYLYKYNKFKKNYYKYCLFSPVERLADIKSIEISGKISRLLQEENTINLIKVIHCNYLLSGYREKELKERIDSPTKFYLDKQNCIYDWDYIEDLATNMPQIKRIKLGLDCDENKLNEIYEKQKELSKKLIR